MSNVKEIVCVCVCVGGWRLKVSPFKDIKASVRHLLHGQELWIEYAFNRIDIILK